MWATGDSIANKDGGNFASSWADDGQDFPGCPYGSQEPTKWKNYAFWKCLDVIKGKSWLSDSWWDQFIGQDTWGQTWGAACAPPVVAYIESRTGKTSAPATPDLIIR